MIYQEMGSHVLLFFCAMVDYNFITNPAMFRNEEEGIENGDKVPCICQFENHASVVITSVHLIRGLSQNLRCAYASRFRDTSFK